MYSHKTPVANYDTALCSNLIEARNHHRRPSPMVLTGLHQQRQISVYKTRLTQIQAVDKQTSVIR